MNRVLILIIFLACGLLSNAQINEVGIFAGGSNYIGDIGKTNFINPNQVALGLIYKWNRSTRHSYRFSFTHSKIAADDADSKASGRRERGYSFENTINELSAGFEFNFFDFDLHHFKPQTTPYIATGINYYSYNELYFFDGIVREDAKERGISIPIILGVKSRINNDFVIGIEAGVRYTFTDNLDGSNPKNKDYANLKFGNLNSNDWYVFSGITLTYTFGENPCFCPN